MMARAPSLDLVFNVGSRPVGSPCGFGVPAAFFVFVFDNFGVTRDGLFLGSGLCGGQCIGMGGEGFRENAVDLVGPASIMFDDLVRNFHHGEIPASAKGAAITLSRSGAVAPAQMDAGGKGYRPRAQAMQAGLTTHQKSRSRLSHAHEGVAVFRFCRFQEESSKRRQIRRWRFRRSM